MKITELYEIKISTNENTINTNDIITLTINLIDFNKNSVANKSVTVSCELGKFNNNTKNITGTTDTNGIFTVEYTGVDSGLETITVNKITNYQFFVRGWKEVTISYSDWWEGTRSSFVKLYVNECLHLGVLEVQSTNYISTDEEPYQNYAEALNLIIPNKYLPKIVPILSPIYYGDGCSRLFRGDSEDTIGKDYWVAFRVETTYNAGSVNGLYSQFLYIF